jgi:hypothetical protein
VTVVRARRAADRSVLVIGAWVLMTACLATTDEPTSSVSQGASGSLAAPLGCAEIDLRAPNGDPIDLTGTWAAQPPDVGFFLGPTEMTWIRQEGSCLWAAIMDAEFRADPGFTGRFDDRGGNLGTYQGAIGNDFVVDGELILVRLGNPVTPSVVAPVRLIIGFGPDGQISLTEDRDPAILGPRCYRIADGTSDCPDPVILYPVDGG